jgi:hypothetical protein
MDVRNELKVDHLVLDGVENGVEQGVLVPRESHDHLIGPGLADELWEHFIGAQDRNVPKGLGLGFAVRDDPPGSETKLRKFVKMFQ